MKMGALGTDPALEFDSVRNSFVIRRQGCNLGPVWETNIIHSIRCVRPPGQHIGENSREWGKKIGDASAPEKRLLTNLQP